MKKFWNWLKNLFREEDEQVNELPLEQDTTANEEEQRSLEELLDELMAEEEAAAIEEECHCGCECHTYECKEVVDEADEFFKFLEEVDWDNLTIGDINALNSFSDLHPVCDDYINWYKISKFKGLPHDFICKYKDKIIWKEYNKSYLKKVTKEMLKAEGYLA